MGNRRSLLAVGLVLMAVAAIFWRLKSAESPAKHASSLFPMGQYRYDVNLSSQGSIDSSAMVQKPGITSQGMPEAQRIQSVVNGQMIVEAGPQSLRLRLESAKVSLQGQGLGAEIDMGLQKGIRVNLDSQGRFLSIQMPRDQPSMVTTIWLSILGELQVVHNTNKLNQWDAEETDHQLRYQTGYIWNAPNLKRTRRITGRPHLANILQGSLEIAGDQTWEADFQADRLDQLKSHWTIAMQQAGQKHYENSQDFSLKFSRVESGLIWSDAPLTVALAYDEKLLDTLTLERTERGRYTEEAGSIRFDEIIKSLHGSLSRGEETELYKKIRAYVYLHPEVCDQLVPLLIEAPYDQIEIRTLGMALGRIGHPEAQKALRAIIKGRLEDKKPAVQYVHLLAQTRQPTPETLDYLEQLGQSRNPDIREAGLLSSGIAISSHRLSDNADALDRVNRQIDRFSTSTDRADRLHIIDLLGNSEMAESVTYIRSVIDSNHDPKERRLAIEALRSMDSVEAMNLLLGFIKTGSFADQVAAIHALAYQRFSVVILGLSEGVLASSQANEAALRLGYLQWLVNHEESIPDLEYRLQLASTKETEPANRKYIQVKLDQFNASIQKK